MSNSNTPWPKCKTFGQSLAPTWIFIEKSKLNLRVRLKNPIKHLIGNILLLICSLLNSSKFHKLLSWIDYTIKMQPSLIIISILIEAHKYQVTSWDFQYCVEHCVVEYWWAALAVMVYGFTCQINWQFNTYGLKLARIRWKLFICPSFSWYFQHFWSGNWSW